LPEASAGEVKDASAGEVKDASAGDAAAKEAAG